VPKRRRTADRPLYARAASAGGALALDLCAKVTRRPVDFAAILAASGTSLIIVVNAVFLQSGARPAPYFANPKPQAAIYLPRNAEPTASVSPMPVTLAPHPVVVPQPVAAPQHVAVRRDDPIADLIGPSPRIAAVQRVLSDYGYGQIKPSGMLDEATANAIQKFEREHKLPVAGRVSDRLIGELAAMVGRPIE
jgi:hypothetical protein